MTRTEALKHVYDMAEQALDGSASYDEWPEAYEALNVLTPEVYPLGDNFVMSEITFAAERGIRQP